MAVSMAAGDGVLVVGVTGPSCSGKSTIVDHLSRSIEHTIVVHQDDFYYDLEDLEVDSQGRALCDAPECLKLDLMLGAVRRALEEPHNLCQTCGLPLNKGNATHLLLVEGTMILSLRDVRPLLHATIFITTDYQRCLQRRDGRVYPGDYLDPPGYFDDYVWPSYLQQKQFAEGDSTVVYLDGNLTKEEMTTEASVLCSKIMDQYRGKSS